MTDREKQQIITDATRQAMRMYGIAGVTGLAGLGQWDMIGSAITAAANVATAKIQSGAAEDVAKYQSRVAAAQAAAEQARAQQAMAAHATTEAAASRSMTPYLLVGGGVLALVAIYFMTRGR
jgi:hypothetical protein